MPEPLEGEALRSSAPPPSRFRRWSSRRVRVEDDSMRPTLEPGDRLLVDVAEYRRRAPRAGEIVILVDPADPSRWLVKRVTAVDATASTLDVRGDAVENARDSREFGPVPLDSVIGHVYECYYPVPRRRTL
jgi:nickel-type superoxide dismutase maturation protease